MKKSSGIITVISRYVYGVLKPMSAIMEFFGLGELTGLTLVFGISALIGGFLFLIWFLLMMIGGAVGDMAQGLFEVEMGDTDLSFKALTFQGISAFFMMFGLIGLWLVQSEAGDTIAVIAGLTSGGISMWLIGKLFEGFKQLEETNTVDISRAIGSTGEVYLRVPSSGKGQVQVTFQGQLRTYDAISSDGKEYSTGEYIEVTGVMAGDTLEIKGINNSSEEE